MDFSSLSPTLQFLTVATAFLTAIGVFIGLPKIVSDLGLNRVTQKKHRAELIQTLTVCPKEGESEPHPMVIQAQFHAAFGAEAWLIPSGKDLRHFLSKPALATLKTTRDLAASLSLVTYSELADGFTPTGEWTAKKLDLEFLYQSIAYWVAALVTTFCFANSHLARSLGWFAALGITYAISKAHRAGQINRARRLLELTPESAH